MKVVIMMKNVYGNVLFYPVCDAAKILAKIAGKRTFSYGDLSNIKALGYAVEYVNAYEALEV